MEVEVRVRGSAFYQTAEARGENPSSLLIPRLGCEQSRAGAAGVGRREAEPPPTPPHPGGSVKPTYTVLDVQAEEQPAEERRRGGGAQRGPGDREAHESRRLLLSERAPAPSFQSAPSKHRNTHACGRTHTHTRTPPHAPNAPPPGTRVSHSPASSYG